MRGLGSLLQLGGRDIRKSNGSKKNRQQLPEKERTGGEARPTNHLINSRPTVGSGSSEGEGSGRAQCPICRQDLGSGDNAAINSHIDACLSKGSLKKRRNQATLQQFASCFKPSAAAPAAAVQRAASAPPKRLGAGDAAGAAVRGATSAGDTEIQQAASSGGSHSRDASPRQQLALPSPRLRPLPRSPAPAGIKVTISSCAVVGRKFQGDAARCSAGQRVAVQREENNPRDRHALLVTHALLGMPIGHLPRSVAGHLAQVVKLQGVVVEGVVLEDPSSDGAPLLVELQVSLPSTLLSPQGRALREAEAAVERAQQAAAEHAAAHQGTGERLRANFATVAGTVLRHDGHLLDEWELSFAQNFEAMDPAAAALLLRLFQRRGPWFRVGTLAYAEVPDLGKALGTLCMAGLAHLLKAAEEGAEDAAGADAQLATAGSPTASAFPAAAAAAASLTGGATIGAGGGLAALAACQGSGAEQAESSAEDCWEASDAEDDEVGIVSMATVAPLLPLQQLLQQQQQQDQGAATQPDITWHELADLLTVPEIAGVLAGLAAAGVQLPRAPLGGTRAQLLDRLSKLAAQHEAAVRQGLLGATGDVVGLSGRCRSAIDRIQRLFFLNEGHSLSQFLAVDLGGVRYPQYSVHRSRSAFASRAALLAYETALLHAQELVDAVESNDEEGIEDALQHAWAALDSNAHKQLSTGGEELPLFFRRFSAAWVYCMMATVGVSQLEKQKRYKAATERLRQLLGGECCPGRRGYWWHRLSVDTEHLKRTVESLEIAEAALADEWLSHGDRLALQRRVLRLGKEPLRWKVPSWAAAASWKPRERRIEWQPLPNSMGRKSRFIGPDGEEVSVEELALKYYNSAGGGGWHGLHSENGVWATLFGLLFWEVLFMAVPDVLRTPFQTAPLDLDTDAFFESRQGAIQSVLVRISDGEAPAMLEQAWHAHHGTLCRGVSWERQPLSELQGIANCVGGLGLAAVCRLLAEDHAGWSGGMPDLLLWHPGRRAAMLSEVKGPRDQLSDQQLAWLHVLADGGLEVEVLKVVEPGVGGKPKGKKRRRL